MPTQWPGIALHTSLASFLVTGQVFHTFVQCREIHSRTVSCIQARVIYNFEGLMHMFDDLRARYDTVMLGARNLRYLA